MMSTRVNLVPFSLSVATRPFALRSLSNFSLVTATFSNISSGTISMNQHRKIEQTNQQTQT
ncbi:hypothetical protein JHK82_026770 [Glycine max]|nr:hypothetical protein JHK82_026770 [Glycine max]KHN03820.1 hypothetical protein glysoja_011049 [Glycine soja]